MKYFRMWIVSLQAIFDCTYGLG